MKKILLAAILMLGCSTVKEAKACPAIGGYDDGGPNHDQYFLVYQCSGQAAYQLQVSEFRFDVYITLGY